MRHIWIQIVGFCLLGLFSACGRPAATPLEELVPASRAKPLSSLWSTTDPIQLDLSQLSSVKWHLADGSVCKFQAAWQENGTQGMVTFTDPALESGSTDSSECSALDGSYQYYKEYRRLVLCASATGFCQSFN